MIRGNGNAKINIELSEKSFKFVFKRNFPKISLNFQILNTKKIWNNISAFKQIFVNQFKFAVENYF